MLPQRCNVLTHLSSAFLLLAIHIATVRATPYYIDDANTDTSGQGLGSVTYSPSDQWSQEPGCTTCVVQLDQSQVYDGTWHDSSSSSASIQVRFTGIAVTVYFALANTLPAGSSGVSAETHLTFTLDGTSQSNYDHLPTSGGYQYQVAVFSTSGLANSSHTLTIEANPQYSSVMLFDYVQYEVKDRDAIIPPPTSTITSTSTTATSTSSSTTTTSSVSTSSFTSSPTSSTSPTSSRSLQPSSPTQSLSNSSSLTQFPSTTTGTNSVPSVTSSTPSSSLSSTTVVVIANSSSSSNIPVGLIAGVTAGGLGTLVFLVISIILLRRRARREPTFPLLRKRQGRSHGEDGSSFGPMKELSIFPDATPTGLSSAEPSVLLIGNPDAVESRAGLLSTRSWTTIGSGSGSNEEWDRSHESNGSLAMSPVRARSLSESTLPYPHPPAHPYGYPHPSYELDMASRAMHMDMTTMHAGAAHGDGDEDEFDDADTATAIASSRVLPRSSVQSSSSASGLSQDLKAQISAYAHRALPPVPPPPVPPLPTLPLHPHGKRSEPGLASGVPRTVPESTLSLSSDGNTALKAQLDALQEEVARLREQQEFIGVVDAPPQYGAA